ncbi:hypothetical protein E2C01_065032 [Portunus trituberculatus]|uniref:Uncharacterized protein n=1 Tax=Portunus trituberculatus TaxID=210409 RepID=A0A5B7HQM6_PORTR|nr:hypothetical protein [Portunus trituberculatus]
MHGGQDGVDGTSAVMGGGAGQLRPGDGGQLSQEWRKGRWWSRFLRPDGGTARSAPHNTAARVIGNTSEVKTLSVHMPAVCGI